MTALPPVAQSRIAAQLGWDANAELSLRAVRGGDICRAYRLRAGDRRAFLKTHQPSQLAMFEAEAAALGVMARSGAVRVPKVLAVGADQSVSWLALEWLDFGSGSAGAHASLGTALARMHRLTAERFGWCRDNFIGTSPQSNRHHDHWHTFFAQERLARQRDIAAACAPTRRLAAELGQLVAHVPTLLHGHTPTPSLLHGDLWGGNWAALTDGTPVLFDPASYYGDRETDLAMTELFGGFHDDFYAAYHAAWPTSEGYGVRRDLYQLYHIVNHANLFGGGYIERARGLTGQLLNS